MRSILTTGLVLLLTIASSAQTAKAKPKAKAKRPTTEAAVTVQDVNALRQAVEAQQLQIQLLQQQLQQRDQAWQQVQQQLQQAQSAASDAQTKAAAAETVATEQKEGFTRLQTDVADVKSNMTTAALNTQEEQKRGSALEGLVGRFRFSGDVRVRQEDFFQSGSGSCIGAQAATCNARVRERVRLRLGIESKLGEDFIAGMFLASGVITDPTSTNETLTSAFERKTISFDRGYIIYNPRAHKWLTLTGGKFAYTWIRTPQTFDSDLNPEGFSEKLSFNLKSKVFKNVTFTGMQLLFNEANRPATSGCVAGFEFCANGGNTKGADSYAVGGQAATKLQLGNRVTVSPSYSVLNWRNEDTLLNQPASIIAAPNAPGITVVPTGNPLTAVSVALTSGQFAPNGITNATVTVGTVGGQTIRRFLSRFLYSDLIVDTDIKTGWERWPLQVRLEYLDNLNAADHPFSNTGVLLTSLGRQSHLYLAQATLGQLKQPKDWRFTYSFHRQEQDSVIASFNESDQRAPTNIIQHRITADYLLRRNVVLEYTLWVGRTLNSNLQNAVVGPGVTLGTSTTEPYLKRMQFDVIYTF